MSISSISQRSDLNPKIIPNTTSFENPVKDQGKFIKVIAQNSGNKSNWKSKARLYILMEKYLLNSTKAEAIICSLIFFEYSSLNL